MDPLTRSRPDLLQDLLAHRRLQVQTWARLQVQPAALRCASCRAEAEHGGPMPQAA